MSDIKAEGLLIINVLKDILNYEKPFSELKSLSAYSTIFVEFQSVISN